MSIHLAWHAYVIDVSDGMRHADGSLQEGTAPINVTGKVNNGTYADYIPHPAFQFFKSEKGFWVGKYETSTTYTIQPGKESIKIDPSAATPRGQIGSWFTELKSLQVRYGQLRGYSHMMKNTEWGAVAYLTESKYGRNGTEVTVNSSTTTGGATSTGGYRGNTAQSTTGNVYGIYDMAGGAQEVMAAYVGTDDVNIVNDNNNYTFGADEKYKNVYLGGSHPDVFYNALKDKKGDAIYEMATGSGYDRRTWYSGYFPNVMVYELSPAVIVRRWL